VPRQTERLGAAGAQCGYLLVLPEEDVVQLLSRERLCGQSHSFFVYIPKNRYFSGKSRYFLNAIRKLSLFQVRLQVS
jgi:hypothetical protein